jgi:hypothetical protein
MAFCDSVILAAANVEIRSLSVPTKMQRRASERDRRQLSERRSELLYLDALHINRNTRTQQLKCVNDAHKRTRNVLTFSCIRHHGI